MVSFYFPEEKEKIVDELKKGRIGILPTDTIFGILTSAFCPSAVERLYRIKNRSFKKPFIILISKINDLEKFEIKIDQSLKNFLKKLWPKEVSVILPCPQLKFKYLHRGRNDLAFRIPADSWLREIIRKSGPLVAPSANPEGFEPAQDILEAFKYFRDKIDFYVLTNKKLKSQPSTLIKIQNNSLLILRAGKVKRNFLNSLWEKSKKKNQQA